jgi:hypothetical protein
MAVASLWLLVAYPAVGGVRGGEAPAELLPFVLPGHEVLDVATGDFNGDGRADAVLVLKPREERPGNGDMELRRPLLLLVRRADGRLEQARRNDKVVYCQACGGMMGDPYQGIEVKDGTFTITHYGGSGSRWGNGFTFAHDAARKDWFLEREYSSSFQATDPVAVEEETFTREELGDLSLADFDPFYWESPKTKWRVVVPRAHFYDRPRLESPRRKAYLVQGDVVEAVRDLRRFVQVSFDNSKGERTDGYLLKNDLEPLDPAR